jgi:hypothetical protein
VKCQWKYWFFNEEDGNLVRSEINAVALLSPLKTITVILVGFAKSRRFILMLDFRVLFM